MPFYAEFVFRIIFAAVVGFSIYTVYRIYFAQRGEKRRKRRAPKKAKRDALNLSDTVIGPNLPPVDAPKTVYDRVVPSTPMNNEKDEQLLTEDHTQRDSDSDTPKSFKLSKVKKLQTAKCEVLVEKSEEKDDIQPAQTSSSDARPVKQNLSAEVTQSTRMEIQKIPDPFVSANSSCSSQINEAKERQEPRSTTSTATETGTALTANPTTNVGTTSASVSSESQTITAHTEKSNVVSHVPTSRSVSSDSTTRNEKPRYVQCFCREHGRSKPLADEKCTFDAAIKYVLQPTDILPISYSRPACVNLLLPPNGDSELSAAVFEPQNSHYVDDFVSPFNQILNAITYAHSHSALIANLLENYAFLDNEHS